MDDKAQVKSRAYRRCPVALLPSEASLELLSTQQERSFGDCYRWSLSDAERRHWAGCGYRTLAGLRVFSCGIFVEARWHRWERKDLPEGVLIYCTEGAGHYLQDGREYEVRAGDLLYCPPTTHHSYWADAERPWTIYWMHLSGKLLPEFERLLGLVEDGPVRHIGMHDELIGDFTRMITHPPLSADSASQWFYAQTVAVGILGRIAGLPKNISEIAAAYGPIQKAIRLMKVSLDQGFDLRRFALESGYGSRHFSRQFRRVTGLSPGHWFTRQKMLRARELLTLPNIRIKSVSTRVGYQDPLHFSRVFKKNVGLSPEAYRQRAARGTTSGNDH